jgi:RsiW-degrading membrane proteinase PrsW (M82 family)
MTVSTATKRETPMDNPRPGGQMKSRDPAEPSRSQLMPMTGAWQEVLAKPYFWPAVMACLGLTAMWATVGNRGLSVLVPVAGVRGVQVQLPLYYGVLALLLTAAGAFAIYRMVGKPKAWWLMPAVIAFLAVLCDTPVMGWLQAIFGLVGSDRSDGSIVGGFFHNLFAAGLPEETIKAIPVALGVYIGARLLARLHPSHPARQFAVLDPLDGILIGAAAGFGFAFTETLFDYVPRNMVTNEHVLVGMLAELKAKGLNLGIKPGASRNLLASELFATMVSQFGRDAAQLRLDRIVASSPSAGLELLLPRLVGNVFGHAAYAGVFGYFIGLAAMKPGQRLKTLGIGLAIACSLHASWNAAAGKSSLFMFVVAMAAFVMLAVCIVKARQISPERSRLLASQVIAEPAVAAPQALRPQVPVGPAAAAASLPAAPAAPKSMTWDDGSDLRILEIGSARIPASVGARLWERQAPGAVSARGDGVVAEVTAHPQDPALLGLKNLSQQAWAVTLVDGTRRELAAGRSIRLEAGMTLVIGELTAAVR